MKRSHFAVLAALVCFAGSGVTLASEAAAFVPSTAPTSLTVAPSVQSAGYGSTVTVHVSDQAGNPISGSPNITYTVSGANQGTSGSATSDGTITYRDSHASASSHTDSISIVDNTDALTAHATVYYVAGGTTPSQVTVDTSGKITDGLPCGAPSHSAATGVQPGHVTTVCAVVANVNGERLAGSAINLTVSVGQIAAVGALGPSSGTSLSTTTDASGVAYADVTMTAGGVQNVTGNAGGASGGSTVTYAPPGPTPTPTASSTPTPTPTTILTPTPTPTPTPTATHSTSPTPNPTATATGAVPKTLTLTASHPPNLSSNVTITATATNSDGTHSAGQVVRFNVSGANNASGSGSTDAQGHVTFFYYERNGGTDDVYAFVDTNNDGAESVGREPDAEIMVNGGEAEDPNPGGDAGYYVDSIHIADQSGAPRCSSVHATARVVGPTEVYDLALSYSSTGGDLSRGSFDGNETIFSRPPCRCCRPAALRSCAGAACGSGRAATPRD